MAKVRRNEPCACGSGRKTKRCCAAPPGGPSPQQQAAAWLATQARAWALDAVDTPLLRAHLGRGVVALHDDGHRIPCDVAAYALVDLADEPASSLVAAALVRTLAVTSGVAPTPSGLVLAGD